MTKPPILFIHGAIVTGKCWDNFSTYFASRGYQTSAPNWPHKGMAGQEAELSKLGLGEIEHYYAQLIKAMPEAPILVGHSFGGLLVQLLRSHGYGCAAVTIDSAPPQGVFTVYPSVFKGTWAGVQAGLLGKTFKATRAEFNYGFLNGLPTDFQTKTYDEQVVTETGRIFKQGLLKDLPGRNVCTVDFMAHPEIPLLMIGGDNDHLCPEKVTRANWKKYQTKKCQQVGMKADYKNFPQATHWLMAQPGVWENVAETIEQWIITKH